jgi:hypothetical protein
MPEHRNTSTSPAMRNLTILKLLPKASASACELASSAPADSGGSVGGPGGGAAGGSCGSLMAQTPFSSSGRGR